MYSRLPLALWATGWLSQSVYGAPTSNNHGNNHGSDKCPPFSGNFTINAYQLYPENGDFDFNNCVLYIGILWNASLGIYDPYKDKLQVVEFPGISHNPEYHLGGVQFNENNNLLSIVVDAGAAFNTAGQDISGTNWIMLWDPKTKKTLYKHNLTEISQGRYGGPQDLEHDPDDNTYIVNTFPSAIQKVSPDGSKIETWYLRNEDNHTVWGYGGLAAADWTLLTNDQKTGNIYAFDMRAEHGTPSLVKVTPPYKIGATDAIQLPARYKNTVLVVTESSFGFSVFRDKTAQWKEAEFVGLVNWTDLANGVPTAPLQVGDAVYANLEPFADPGLGGAGTAGNRSSFLYWDMTAEIDKLLKK